MIIIDDIMSGSAPHLLLLGLTLALFLGTSLGWAAGFAFRSRKVNELEVRLGSESDQASLLRDQTNSLSAELDLNRAEIERLGSENIGFIERVHHLEDKIESQTLLEESISQTLKEQFSDVAQLVQNAQRGGEAPVENESLQQLLAPVTEQFAELGERIEQFMSGGNPDPASSSQLQELMQSLGDYTKRIDSSADQLLQALRSEHKVYGNWGKTVLGRIMELAGLVEGREYRPLPKDESMRNPDLLAPDIIVSLPGNRDLLIDSKVSLEHWNNYVNVAEADESKRNDALGSFAQEIRNRIDVMGEQDYTQFPSVREVDFLFLFIPVEAAWMHLMQEDPSIATYAQENRIAVVSASNLLLALKLVTNLWHSEERLSNVDKIIERAHLLYKKWQSFAQDLARVGTALNRMQNEYGRAMDKLTSGRGNLVRQTEELIRLGVDRPAGKLPDSVAVGMLTDELEDGGDVVEAEASQVEENKEAKAESEEEGKTKRKVASR